MATSIMKPNNVSATKPIRGNSTDSTYQKLRRMDKQMSLVTNLSNNLPSDQSILEYEQQLNDLTRKVHDKALEYVILEAMAIHSQDEQVKDARENLFLVTNIQHGEEIADIVRYAVENKTNLELEQIIDDHCSHSTKDVAAKDIPQTILDNVYNIFRTSKNRFRIFHRKKT